MQPDLSKGAHLSRRGLIAGTGAFAAWASIPRFAKASGRDPRLVVIVLRGGLDGLAAVAPLGDPGYSALRGPFTPIFDSESSAFPLGSFFALHPAMQVFARLYRQGQAAVIHAVATPYRERSHIGGLEVLESGEPRPGSTTSGWLNRALTALPSGSRVAFHGGIAMGAATPLILRGSAPVLGWSLQAPPPSAISVPLRMRQTAQRIAELIAADDGPRIAALVLEGWDTHSRQGGAAGRLARLLGGLDAVFEEFEMRLKTAWADTAIVAITEFGRTVRTNASGGTDHGSGGAAFLAGGAIKGGRVIADWPGLAPKRLYEGRDLLPTADLRAVLGGILKDHLGLSEKVIRASVFPESGHIRPAAGLIA